MLETKQLHQLCKTYGETIPLHTRSFMHAWQTILFRGYIALVFTL